VSATREADPSDVVVGGPYPETLLVDLEELGINGSQARVLLALLQLGSGHSTEIARLAQVPRTAVYPLLKELGAKRLVARVAGDGPAIWASAGRDEVINRLNSAHEERIRQQQARAERVRLTLEEVVPADAPGSLPFIHFIPGAAQGRMAYEQLLASATTELLVFRRPPFSSQPGPVNRLLREALARGVRTSVLFESPPGHSEEDRQLALDTYRQVGVDSRVVDALPVKLIIADQRVVLITISDRTIPDGGFPTSLLVENEDYAAMQTVAFATYWDTGRGPES